MDEYITRQEFKNAIAKIDKIHDHIVGNGHPGLTERVRVIERFVESRIAIERWVMRTVGGVILLGTLTAALWIIRQMG